MKNHLKRWALFPFRMLWHWTDVVRDRAIRRLDQRLDVALTEHLGRSWAMLTRLTEQTELRLSSQIAEVSARQRHELETGLRSVDFCLESVLRELTRLHWRLDELAAEAPSGRREKVGEGREWDNEPGPDSVVLPFTSRRVA